MINITEILVYLEKVSPDSKIYVGCDSEVVKTRKTKETKIRYASVVVVHISGSSGAKVFGEVTLDNVLPHERYKIKPQHRLMNEVYQVVDLYNDLIKAMPDKIIDIHLDLNPKKEHLSNKVVQQALGYVKGVTGKDAVLKPNAWAASAAADKWCELKTFTK